MNLREVRPALRVANWNVRRATPVEARWQRIQEQCATIEADLWFLTETHREFSPHKGHFSLTSGVPDREGKPGECWSAIWSKWPMESLHGYVTDSARCVAGYIPKSPFGEIINYATVLPWNTDPRAKESSSDQVFADAINMQKSDWLRIQNDFPQATLILAGDFNQDLAVQHYYGSRKKRALLESTLVDCNLIALTGGEDDPIARDSPPMACIDHICISVATGWALGTTTRWPDDPKPIKSLSDHFGVAVKLQRQPL